MTLCGAGFGNERRYSRTARRRLPSSKGYFTRHNIKFKPRTDHPDFITKDDSNHSDIDVIGYHPRLSGPARVVAVSCKSWQGGFNVEAGLRDIAANRRVSGREAWKFLASFFARSGRRHSVQPSNEKLGPRSSHTSLLSRCSRVTPHDGKMSLGSNRQ